MRAETLSAVDAAWLHMEDPANLMVVSGVIVFARPLPFQRLKDLLREKLLRHDRFRQRAVEPFTPLGTPRWEEDDRFDIDAHVHRIALPAPHDQRALQALVSDLMSTPLDFTKPLWQFHLIEDVEDGCAVMVRIHHSVGDGVALVDLFLSMADGAPVPRHLEHETVVPPGLWARVRSVSAELLGPVLEGDREPVAEDTPRGGAPASTTASLLEPAREALARTIERGESLLHGGVEALRHPEALLKWLERGAGGLNAVAKLLLMEPDPHTILKGPLGVEKRAAWSGPIHLDDVKAVALLAGGTVNDVLLTCAAGALRRYLESRGESTLDLTLRAVVPVNLRPPTDRDQLGNRFGLVYLPLPVGIEDPLERLAELKERMDEIKHSPEAIVAFGILGALGHVPAAVERAVVDLFGARGTAVMTNVPGPQRPLVLAGEPVKSLMFWVPQSGRLGLGLSILSYCGNVSIGIASDAHLVPDPDTLVAAFQAEFQRLLDIVRADWELVEQRRSGAAVVRDSLRRPAERAARGAAR